MPGTPMHTGGRLNIKMLSYQYRDTHVKGKTVSPTVLSLTWESPYLGKTVFILRRGPGVSRWPKDTDCNTKCRYQRLTLVQTQITLASLIAMIDVTTRL